MGNSPLYQGRVARVTLFASSFQQEILPVLRPPSCLNDLPVWVSVAGTAIAMIGDLQYLRIPNWLTYPLCLSGLLFHGWMSGVSGIVLSLEGLGLGFALLFVPFAIGAFGAGDVKLLAAIGAWIGPERVFAVVFFSLIAMFIYSLVVLARTGRMRASWVALGFAWRNMVALAEECTSNDSDAIVEESDWLPSKNCGQTTTSAIPFSVMIAVGLVVTCCLVGLT